MEGMVPMSPYYPFNRAFLQQTTAWHAWELFAEVNWSTVIFRFEMLASTHVLSKVRPRISLLPQKGNSERFDFKAAACSHVCVRRWSARGVPRFTNEQSQCRSGRLAGQEREQPRVGDIARCAATVFRNASLGEPQNAERGEERARLSQQTCSFRSSAAPLNSPRGGFPNRCCGSDDGAAKAGPGQRSGVSSRRRRARQMSRPSVRPSNSLQLILRAATRSAASSRGARSSRRLAEAQSRQGVSVFRQQRGFLTVISPLTPTRGGPLEKLCSRSGGSGQRPRVHSRGSPGTSDRSAGGWTGRQERGSDSARLRRRGARVPGQARVRWDLVDCASPPAHHRYSNLTLQPPGPAPSVHSGQSSTRTPSAFGLRAQTPSHW
ncbi:hypothetical protein AOLI_G00066570 [Acnodon oligacanthus]